VMSPLTAVILSAILNVAGAFLSTKVAKMIGGGLVNVSVINPATILAAMTAAMLWNGWMTVLGMPVSGSHALIGGLLGAALFTGGVSSIQIQGVLAVLLALLLSPLLGMLFGFFFMVALMWIFRRVAPSLLNRIFGVLQIGSASFMALSHGTNDAQKVMGIITLALVSGGVQSTMEVPHWVMGACALVIGLGTAFGGWGVIKTLGHGLMKLQPIHGFAAETSAVAVLMGSALIGVPVSTTHVMTSSIIGVGAAKKLSAVKWGVGGKILTAWIFTFPCTALVAALLCALLKVAGLH
jgi:inorganic phosphate transporter, PiT family